MISCTDWLQGCDRVTAHSVDLLYADPPFNTGRAHRAPPNGHKRRRDVDVRFEDRFASVPAYLSWLGDRVAATLPLLKPTASILLHVDWRTCHHVRLLLDELLGPECFVNHLVWSYGLGGSSARRFARKHDDILWYAVDPERYWFEPPRVPATSRRLAGRMKKATDVLDIPALNNMAAERTGYPTQKPVALLDLLIRACCPPGGTVLDPCCGSGTALVAAVAAGRCAIGFDLNPAAVAITRRRLAALPKPGRS